MRRGGAVWPWERLRCSTWRASCLPACRQEDRAACNVQVAMPVDSKVVSGGALLERFHAALDQPQLRASGKL